MTTRRISSFATAASVLLTLAACGSAMADDFMARFEGTTTGSGVMYVAAYLLDKETHVRAALPNEEMKKGATGTPQPKKDLAAAVKKMNPGDICKVSLERTNLGITLVSIEAYDTKPGEETPNGYVFSKTFDNPGKNTGLTVVLTKFGVETKFTIVTKKDDKGVVAQDPDVLAAIDKLQAGNSVWIQTQGKSILTAIEPYVDPKIGKLGKKGETEVDGHKVPSYELETEDGKTVTLLVPVKPLGKTFQPDKAVMAQLAKLKVNAAVAYRVHEEGDKLWLREILPAPANAKPPMADKTDTPKKK